MKRCKLFARRRLARLRPMAAAAGLALAAGGSTGAEVTWVGPDGSFWDLPANWNPNPPGRTDDALLGAFDAALRSVVSVRSLTGTGRLTYFFSGNPGGTLPSLDIASASSIGALTMTGGFLYGSGDLTIAGPSIWTGGWTFGSGSTIFNGPVTVGGATIGRNVTLAGTSTWTGAEGFFDFSGGTLTNSGTFLDQRSLDGSFRPGSSGAGVALINAGTYTKSGNSTTTIGVGYTHSGTFNVDAGTLRFTQGGSSSSGTFAVATAATLNFGGGAHTLNSASSITGGGRVLVSDGTVASPGTLTVAGSLVVTGGTLNINGTSSAASFVMTGGTVGGPGTLTITGAATLNRGSMSGTGSTVFNGPLTVSGLSLNGRTAVFGGTTTWTNGSPVNGLDSGRIFVNNGSTLTNSGTFLDQTAFNTDFSGTGPFVNFGSYIKSGTSTTTVGIALSNPGTLTVNAGTLALTASANFTNAGTVGGNAILQTSQLTNNGHLRPGFPLGTLTLSGNYVQGASGFFDVDLNVPGRNDVFIVNGTATLGGTLALSCFENCGYAVGDSILILDSTGPLSGTFASVTLGGFETGAFSVIYDTVATRVTLQVIQTVTSVPEPATCLLMAGGLLFLANRAHRRGP